MDDAIIKRLFLLKHTVTVGYWQLCHFWFSSAVFCRQLLEGDADILQNTLVFPKIGGVVQKLDARGNCELFPLPLELKKDHITTTLFRVRIGPGNPAKLTSEMMQLLYYSWLLMYGWMMCTRLQSRLCIQVRPWQPLLPLVPVVFSLKPRFLQIIAS